jgi:hypothetical protein
MFSSETATMANPDDFNVQNNVSNVKLCAFALTDCIVHIESQSAKYLRAVHRTALELAVPNLFGSELGGFWLKSDQIDQLRKLPDCYPANEVEFVRRAVDAYLQAQIDELELLQSNNLRTLTG